MYMLIEAAILTFRRDMSKTYK